MLRIAVAVVIALSAAAAGCATPKPVVRLHPTFKDTVWQSGRAIVARQAADLRVAAAFERMTEDSVVLRVEVQNEGQTAREVGPEQMVYRACPVRQNCRPRRAVVNPEAALLALDKERASTRASQATNNGIGGVLMLLSAVGTVAAIASGDGKAAGDFADDGLHIAHSTESSNQRHESRLAAIETEKTAWATTAFRRTTLGPGQGVAGFVHLPLELDAGHVWLGVNAGDRMLWFEFEQIVIHPYP